MDSTEILVAHNLEFDVPVVDAELLRVGYKRKLFRKRKICTLKYGKGLSSLLGEPRKFPSLPFMCSLLFPGSESNYIHHEAKVDVLLTGKVFQKIIEYDVVKEEWIKPKSKN